MTAILGISAFYHDSAAALVVDGKVVAAAQEERFSRIKHDARFPHLAIQACLDQAGIDAADLDHVGFYEKPLLKFDRLLETYLSFAPVGFRSFRKAMPEWTSRKLLIRREIRRGLGGRYGGRICFCEHHQSHAASAFFPSPFSEAAILTMDGVGEWATATIGVGRENKIELQSELRFPHSLGLLYSAFTYFTGFEVNGGEYKLMGLAPYGEPRFADVIQNRLMTLHEDGSLHLNLDFFQFCQGLTMTSRKFDQLFGRRPRKADQPIEQLDMDLAASIQQVTEEAVLRMTRTVHCETHMKHLCLSGGVALNCVANGRLLREGPFEKIWIQPAANDAGGALGVAMFIWHQLLEKPRSVVLPDGQQGSLLGPTLTNGRSISAELDRLGVRHEQIADPSQRNRRIAKSIADGDVVGIARGRMEFGPRALGNRSIVADPRNANMQSHLNQAIKFRESFRPFAPAILKRRAGEYFDLPKDDESPYMLVVAQVSPHQHVSSTIAGHGRAVSMSERLAEVRSSIPAVTHVDHSARIQTVDCDHFPEFNELLEAFETETGCPVLINTSFNVRDQPIVCDLADAVDCFRRSGLDWLVVEDCLVHKSAKEQMNLDLLKTRLHREDPDALTSRQLSWFCLSLALSLFLLALVARFGWDLPSAGSVFLLLGFVVFGMSVFAPSSRRGIRNAFLTATLPVRWLVTIALLGMLYYGIVTPIGWCRRLTGNDVRKVPPGATSNWQPCKKRRLESYFDAF